MGERIKATETSRVNKKTVPMMKMKLNDSDGDTWRVRTEAAECGDICGMDLPTRVVNQMAPREKQRVMETISIAGMDRLMVK